MLGLRVQGPACSYGPRHRSGLATSGRPSRVTAPRCHRLQIKAGLFDAFTGGKTAVVRVSPKTQEKVEELLSLTDGTNAGSNIAADDKEAVENLVRELEGLSMRAPAKSPLLTGVWEVVYKTSPDGLGNPFLRNPLGQAALRDQTYYQVLDTDGELRNVIQWKTLGLVPGEVQQGGAWEVTGPNTIKFTFKTAERELEVVFLNEQLRITKLVKEDGEDTYIVFRRVEEEEEMEEEEIQETFVEEAEEDTKRGGLFGGLLGGAKSQEGLATQVERSVQRQAGSQNTKERGTGRSATQQIARGTQSVSPSARSAKFDPAAAAEARKAEAEQRRKEAEQAAERRRQEAEARKQEAAVAAQRRKEEAEAKRQAAQEAAEAKKREAEEARQRQLEIREALAELREEVKEAQQKSRAATAEFKAFEKQAVAALRDSGRAVALIEDAQERSEAVEQELQAARQRQAECNSEVKAAQQELKEAEQAFTALLRK